MERRTGGNVLRVAERKSRQGATLILFSVGSLTDVRCELINFLTFFFPFLIVKAMFRYIFSVQTESVLTDSRSKCCTQWALCLGPWDCGTSLC